jgi:hypothetical protein
MHDGRVSMDVLETVLQRENVIGTLGRLGLSVDEVFPGLASLGGNPYRHHRWMVKENHGYLVINAIPEEADQDHLFWEEWYSFEQEVHHHILTLYKPFMHHEIYQAPAGDDLHPPQCFSKKWYVVEDPDMRALLLRR